MKYDYACEVIFVNGASDKRYTYKTKEKLKAGELALVSIHDKVKDKVRIEIVMVVSSMEEYETDLNLKPLICSLYNKDAEKIVNEIIDYNNGAYND